MVTAITNAPPGVTVTELLDKLPARNSIDALTAVAGGSADVSLRLVHGHTVSGRVLSVGEAKRGVVVLVAGRDGEVTYVEVTAIVAVTVVSAARHAAALSDGKVVGPLPMPLGAPPPPTRFEIKRNVVERSKAAGIELEIRWGQMPEEGEELRVLAAALDDIVSALQSISEDAMGKEAVAALQKVIVDNGATNVAKVGNALVVTIPLARGGALHRAAMKVAIESAL